MTAPVPEGLDELLALLKAHDGDDRCGCLRSVIVDLINEEGLGDALDTMRYCLAEHPAGITWRTELLRDLSDGT